MQNRKNKKYSQIKTQRGFGLIDALIYIAVISIVISVSMSFLSDTMSQDANYRKSSLVKKSFGGAEIVLIDQRQCKCNLKLQFPSNIARNAKIDIARIKTFENVATCIDGANDAVLAETTATAVLGNRTSALYLTDFTILIPDQLYRAQLVMSADWGKPVNFPILMSTHDEGGDVIVDICGVDRAS